MRFSMVPSNPASPNSRNPMSLDEKQATLREAPDVANLSTV